MIEVELKRFIDQFRKNNPPGCLKNPEAYASWLAQTYFFVRHSVPMLAYAIPHLKSDELKSRFGNHMGEEHRHDLVALKDLEKLGKKISDFKENSFTQAFYQSQFFRIQFEGATSVLGYILFLEALACTWAKDEYEILKKLYPKATLFLKIHAEEDPDHVEKAISAISNLPVDEQKLVLRNLEFTYEIYQQILRSTFPEEKKAAA